MKILHTSDWHLGKKLFKESRLKEQECYLNWQLEILKQQNIDLLVVAGDIFDVPMPGSDAMKLYYDFVARLESETSTHLFIIAGNHDSANFLEAPINLYNQNRITIVTKIDEITFFQKNILTFLNETIEIVSMPFFRTHELMNSIKNNPNLISQNLDEITNLSPEFLHNAMEFFISNMAPILTDTNNYFRLFVGHHLFGNFISAGSEVGISLSGIESIDLKIFENRFDYMALGHIHKPQTVRNKNPYARYSGPPIPYRFSETENKSVVIIDTKATCEKKYQIIKIPPIRRMVHLKWSEKDHLDKNFEIFKNDILSHDTLSQMPPLIELELLMDAPNHHLVSKIIKLFHQHDLNILSLVPIIHNNEENNIEAPIGINHLTTEELFKLHYQKKYPMNPQMPEQIYHDFKMLLESVRGQANEIP